jgi:segregation and condensation protein B
VTSNEKPETLAEQAASWVPPWSRAPEPADPVTPPDVDEPDGSADDELTEVDHELHALARAGERLPPHARESVVVEDADWDFDVDDDDQETLPRRAGPARGAARGVARVQPIDDDDADTDPQAINSPTLVMPIVAAPAADAIVIAAPPPGPDDELAETSRAERDDPLEPLSPVEIRPAIEAILLVIDEPVGESMLATILNVPVDAVLADLEALAADYTANGRGFDLRRAAGGWRLYTRPAYAPYVERFVLDGQTTRLTQAALETLAVVAYKQPVTRSRISAIRGVNCDGVVRTLVSRGLIEECGTEPESGAFLYKTTNLFLEKLALDKLEDLPPLAPFLPTDVDSIADANL